MRRSFEEHAVKRAQGPRGSNSLTLGFGFDETRQKQQSRLSLKQATTSRADGRPVANDAQAAAASHEEALE